MKIFFILLVIVSSVYLAQTNKVTKDIKTGKPMLIGKTTREAFKDTNFSVWFNYEYTNYNVNSRRLVNCKEKIKNKSIKIIMGTWCSDSRREVPRMIKILDFIDFPRDSIQIINVDRKKKGVANEVEGLNIELVPTIVLYENGKEIGRIIETPEETLEKDLVRIIK